MYCLLQDGDSALMEASLGGHNECLEALLRGGAYVDIRDEVSSSQSMSVADVVPAVCM